MYLFDRRWPLSTFRCHRLSFQFWIANCFGGGSACYGKPERYHQVLAYKRGNSFPCPATALDSCVCLPIRASICVYQRGVLFYSRSIKYLRFAFIKLHQSLKRRNGRVEILRAEILKNTNGTLAVKREITIDGEQISVKSLAQFFCGVGRGRSASG